MTQTPFQKLQDQALSYIEQRGQMDSMIRRWIIIHEPGRVPVIKNPIPSDVGNTHAMLEELTKHYPDARFTICSLDWMLSLHVEDGHQELEIAKSLSEADVA